MISPLFTPVNKCGGGVGFFIKTALDFKMIHSPEFSSLENHTVSLTLNGHRLIVSQCRLPASGLICPKIFLRFSVICGLLSFPILLLCYLW